jgi:hypothetical protein
MITAIAITTALLAISAIFAMGVRFILASKFRAGSKAGMLCVLILGPAGFAWWMAFNSPGSGWGFAIIALMISAITMFGLAAGMLWHRV